MRERILNIQRWLKDNSFSSCIVPWTDPHKSEYIEDHYKLREFLSGFSGSAGTLVITTNKAALFTDSRYHIQASIQLQDSGIELFKSGLTGVPSYKEWLSSEIGNESVAVNASLFSISEWSDLSEKLNIVDNSGFESIWSNRPPLCSSKIFIHDEKFSGQSTASKIGKIKTILKENGADLAIVSSLEDIAWLANIRGADIAYNPVVRSYFVVSLTESTIFVDSNKIDDNVSYHFKSNDINIREYSSIDSFLETHKDCSIIFDKGSLNQHLYEIIKNFKTLINLPLYVSRLRALKNEVEIDGYKESMIKDGVVWVKFYMWFNHSLKNNIPITEISVIEKIRELKSKQDGFIDESFGTIAGYAAHGAIGHYAASSKSNSTIEKRGFLVIDTGTHYLTGTTDTTRTLVCGELSNEEKLDYTLVLKGHIALGKAIFPKGTKGSQLDILARQHLWNYCFNYGHGTGHGVGHLLNVHEGYAWLRPSENNVGYEAGLTMTDEPGIYREGKYGIRIENTVLVVPYSKSEFGEFLTFEHLTLAPYALEAIDTSLLTNDEKDFINNYNNNLLKVLSPYLSDTEIDFLRTITYEI